MQSAKSAASAVSSPQSGVQPTKIGTPLTPGATRVMLLGAGELGKEVIIALQRLGVETIAVDRYANAPGHQGYTAEISPEHVKGDIGRD